MILWTSAEAAAATGGTSQISWQATGVSIDTRSLQPGDLFVALKDVRDGHDFVADALAAGAAACLVSRIPEDVSENAPLLLVPDVLSALEALGAAARARVSGQVIAVTGSVGKTSTKEMLRTALQGQGRVHAAEKSFNNHWGVPLTLARMPQDSDFAIIEIGMNHPGEIAPLAKLARPTVAIVTTVAPAHLEAFDDIAGIAREKASIFSGLTEGGWAIYNADLETSAILAAAAPRADSFGETQGNWRLEEVTLHDTAMICQARHETHSLLFKLAVTGRHFAMNALACLAAVERANGDLAEATIKLAHWSPPDGRGKRRRIILDAVHDAARIDLFDDAYNANPASVAAALDVLAGVRMADTSGRRVAILGDMKELGSDGARLHADLAQLPAMEAIDLVHCVGPLMAHLHAALHIDKRGELVETAAEFAASPARLVQAGDTVLVKGSLSMKMALIVDAVSKLGEAVEARSEDI
ncbi:MAG: UDP-N-acetylmuramoyl-tripeptide--D-alanyl-D-alanine ligase [Pseudomonadota bacterium]